MASQIAHILYAQRYFDASDEGRLPDGMADCLPPGCSRDLFLLGSVFPDIRRVATDLKRKETHMILQELNLDFGYLDSFHAGWKFHLYCDMKREEILNRHRFYDLAGTTDYWNHPAKLLEDEVIYADYRNWEKMVHFLNNPPIVETGINVSQETFDFWFAILARYFEKRPDSRSMRAFLSKQPGLASDVPNIIAAVDKLRKNDRVVEILKKVKDEII